jgi:hypothetical protein
LIANRCATLGLGSAPMDVDGGGVIAKKHDGLVSTWMTTKAGVGVAGLLLDSGIAPMDLEEEFVAAPSCTDLTRNVGIAGGRDELTDASKEKEPGSDSLIPAVGNGGLACDDTFGQMADKDEVPADEASVDDDKPRHVGGDDDEQPN